MRYGVLSWIFGGFIYFKAAFEYAALGDLNVLTALLLAVALGWFVALAECRYRARIDDRPSLALIRGALGPRFAKTFVWMTLYALLFIAVARIIIFAFAPDLSREIRVFGNFMNSFDEDLFTFVGIMLAPALLHWPIFVLAYERPDEAGAQEATP